MKPIKIIMSAFGSYGGVEEIDFTNVNRGLFLITGDTGAGKTTVFDAITYALFDETSGGKRDGDMMRSQYAKEDTPTFVELTFSYGGELYTIKRNPNYSRLSKRKNKDGEYTYTMETASVELTLPNGKIFHGKNRETNEKIKEILGVDVNQFTQISMIAQGEFLKLLHAPSKERKEIFGRIFDTKIYWKIQNQLRDQSKELYVSLSRNADFITRELEEIIPLEEEISEKWGLLTEKLETGKEDIFAYLEEMERTLSEQYEGIRKEEEETNKRLDSLKIQVAQAEETNRQFQQQKKLQDSLANLENKMKELGEEEKKEQEKGLHIQQQIEEKMPGLEQKLAEGKNLLPKYEALTQRQEEVKYLEQKKDRKKQLLADTQAKETEKTKRFQELQEIQKELQPQVETLPQVLQEEKNCCQREKELTELCELEEKIIQIQQDVNLEQEKIEIALNNWKKASVQYEEYNIIFIKEQAGILASQLEEGKPCPVCGSLHHPQKAGLSEEAVTQNMVEDAKKSLEAAQKKLDEKREIFQKKTQELEGFQQIRNNSEKRLFTEENQSIIPKEALGQCTILRKKLEKKRIQLEEIQKQYYHSLQEMDNLQREIQQLSSLQKEQQIKFNEANLSYEKAFVSLKELQQVLTYPSKEVLEKELQEFIKEKHRLDTLQQENREQIHKLKEQMAKKEGSLEEQKKSLELLNKVLEGRQPVDMEDYRQKEHNLLSTKNRLEEARIKNVSQRDRNSCGKENLKKLYASREGLREKYEIAETLSRTANGNLRQQARLDLQTYVQRRYFKHMIGEANRRLMKMSNGKFMLQCRDLEQLGKQGEAGLDLDVYDMVTDKVRDVKTLSGGESFLAALSMALGMADVIQNNAAKVRIETMFIDEGFGSLDEESRGKAIQILQELAGETRLVGIISHVTELKEQMDRKLIVTKEEQGSHAAWHLES